MTTKEQREAKKLTRQNLRTMTRSGGTHRLRTLSRIFKYGVRSFNRNIWLSIASALVMTMTLFILFITVIASVVLNNTAAAMREKIDITIFFTPGTSLQTLTEMENIISADENVKSVTISTTEDEYKNLLAEYADDEKLLATISDNSMKNALLKSMQATMRLKVYDVDNLDSIKDIVATNPTFVANLDAEKLPTYDENRLEITTITNWANIARNAGIILSIVFLVLSMLVIFNTVRIAIFSRREEIYMMKLVGADRTFIRGPFLVEAQICGILSGTIAATLGFLSFKFLAPQLYDYGIDIDLISHILKSGWLALVYLALILLGVFIGTISARLALQKHLK